MSPVCAKFHHYGTVYLYTQSSNWSVKKTFIILHVKGHDQKMFYILGIASYWILRSGESDIEGWGVDWTCQHVSSGHAWGTLDNLSAIQCVISGRLDPYGQCVLCARLKRPMLPEICEQLTNLDVFYISVFQHKRTNTLTQIIFMKIIQLFISLKMISFAYNICNYYLFSFN